ncbi:hypothetical protein K438DRAFT_1748201 [Mycena galopus ATCC 62051]|nr:hypothetical protein K438DRAFT_1748201 [Mycena galopus ATCC 62051]
MSFWRLALPANQRKSASTRRAVLPLHHCASPFWNGPRSKSRMKRSWGGCYIGPDTTEATSAPCAVRIEQGQHLYLWDPSHDWDDEQVVVESRILTMLKIQHGTRFLLPDLVHLLNALDGVAHFSYPEGYSSSLCTAMDLLKALTPRQSKQSRLLSTQAISKVSVFLTSIRLMNASETLTSNTGGPSLVTTGASMDTSLISREPIDSLLSNPLHVYTPTHGLYIDFLFPPSPVERPKFVQVPSLEEADIVVQVDERQEQVVVNSRTPTMLRLQQETRFPLGRPEHLGTAIGNIAHFTYFLERANTVDPITGVTLEMHHLKGERPNRGPDENLGRNGNLVEDGAVQFKAVEGAMYGFTICNTGTEDLFPYLFYFDPDTYTITNWYSPRHTLAPLRSNDALKVGMGNDLAFCFELEPGKQSSSGFVRLFVTRELVSKLDMIEQTSDPFDPNFPGFNMEGRASELVACQWGAVTVMLTMTAE